MIVGRGLLAEAFRARYGDDRAVIIHAAGVSNSSETCEIEFDRERQMLLESLANTCDQFVYFSSCVVGLGHSPPSPYVLHKTRMEALVLESQRGVVFRLPQVVGRTINPNTLTNFLATHIREGTTFRVFSGTYRNLVDIADISLIVPALLSNPEIMRTTTNIAARHAIEVPKLVAILEDILGKKSYAKIVPRQEPYEVDASAALLVASRLNLGLDDGEQYTQKILRKYYG